MSRAAPIFAILLLPAVAGADFIELKNGNRFDDVIILSETENQIRFQLSAGEMSLPTSWVERFEKANGPLQSYLERKEKLESALEEPGSDLKQLAVKWLDLAHWAKYRGLRHGFRESLIKAAELEPDLDGLGSPMAQIGFSQDPTTGLWKTVPAEPAVLTPERARYVARAQAETTPASSPSTEVAAGLTRAIETLAEAELERSRGRTERERTRRTGRTIYSSFGVPFGHALTGWFFPGVPLRDPNAPKDDFVIRNPRNPHARALLLRPPGSILPVSAYKAR